MFSMKIKHNDGVLFINNKENIINSILHTLFVFYPIKVIWLDSKFKVVDVKILKPFTLLAVPQRKAKYILELSPKALKNIKIDTKLKLK